MRMCFALENQVTVCKYGVAAAATDITDAAIIDMAGYDAVAFVAVLGAGTLDTAKITLSCKAGNASDMTGATDLTATATHTATGATSDDGKCLVLDVVQPVQRYLRPVIARATAASEILALLAIRYNAAAIPTGLGDVLAYAVATA